MFFDAFGGRPCAEEDKIMMPVGPDELDVGPGIQECHVARPDLEQKRQDRA